MNNRGFKLAHMIIIGAIVLIVGLSVWWAVGSASWQRNVKSIISDHYGGLDRTVSVYDNTGNLIREYSGRIDIDTERMESGYVFFDDQYGKRHMIMGGVVVIDEN